MREQLTLLREAMERHGITAWISMCRDAHGSEYIGAHDECVRFLSGFTGDSSILLVLPEKAYLWTDGRYFIQGERELKGSGVELMKLGEPGVPLLEEFIEKTASERMKLGFSGRLVGARQGSRLARTVIGKGGIVEPDRDPVDEIWKDRPPVSGEPVWAVPEKYTGRSTKDKLKDLRMKMKEAGASVYVTAALDETAWITNLRGSDISCNPVFLSYLILTDRSCRLYVRKQALTDKALAAMKEARVKVCDYDSFPAALSALSGETVLMDMSAVNYDCWLRVSGRNSVKDAVSPAALLKCVKNEAEQKCMRDCHVRDGVWLTRFLYRLKTAVAAPDYGKRKDRYLTETDAAAMLGGLRASDPKFISLSFPTISAYGPNAALPHYFPVEETAAKILPKGLYLVDSGAQYADGTTDVTRTVALGRTTKEERRNYTLTVVGMLNLMNAVFPKGVRGTNLDTFARQALWARGLDFNHGTGHGVGCLLNVHEGPASVRTRPNPDARRDIPFEPGMVTSDEPGVYVEGSHGIRTENLLLCVRHPKYDGFYCFESLTYAPLDPDPLDLSVMTDEDLDRFNAYQAQVRKKIGPKLNEEERNWLIHETREIRR